MIEVAFVAVITWILMGAFLVYYAQSRMKKWYMLELYAHDSQQLDKLQRSYAKIYSKQKGVGQVQPKLMSIREELEYLILRLIFINPVGLPCMTESFLRKDFHFAMYLAFCYGKVLTKFFKWSLFSLVLLLVLVITLNLTFEAIQDPEARLYINFSFLFVVFIVLILLKSCLTHAEKKLTPSVFDEKTGLLRDPEAFNICFNERQAAVDPFLQYDELPRMSYLEFDAKTTDLSEVEREQLVNDEERQALLNQSVASARGGKNHYARSLAAQEEDGKRPQSAKDAFNVNNKHEQQYCCGRRGVNYLILNTAQFMFILTIVFFAYKVATVHSEYQQIVADSSKLAVHSVLLVFALFFVFYAWFGIIPSLLTSFTITTNVSLLFEP